MPGELVHSFDAELDRAYGDAALRLGFVDAGTLTRARREQTRLASAEQPISLRQVLLGSGVVGQAECSQIEAELGIRVVSSPELEPATTEPEPVAKEPLSITSEPDHDSLADSEIPIDQSNESPLPDDAEVASPENESADDVELPAPTRDTVIFGHEDAVSDDLPMVMSFEEDAALESDVEQEGEVEVVEETQPESEASPAVEPLPDTEPTLVEHHSAPGTEAPPPPTPEPEPAPEASPTPEPSVIQEPDSDPVPEPQPEPEPAPEPESKPEIEPAQVLEPEPQPPTEAATAPAPETEPELDASFAIRPEKPPAPPVEPPDRLPILVRLTPWILLGVLLLLFVGTAWMPNTQPFPKFFASESHQSRWAWDWNKFAVDKLGGTEFTLWPQPSITPRNEPEPTPEPTPPPARRRLNPR